MENWRGLLIKKSMEETPITLELLKNDGLVVGDHISPKENLSNKEGKKIFLEGQAYEVLKITDHPLGLTLNSELGSWFLPFPQSAEYFIQNFVKVTLSEEDQLSRNFDVIPNEIFTLLFEHGQQLPRAAIRKELIAQGFDGKLIQRALVFLEKHEFLQAGNKLGTVALTEKGLKLMQGRE
jgi:hypothetical protein